MFVVIYKAFCIRSYELGTQWDSNALEKVASLAY